MSTRSGRACLILLLLGVPLLIVNPLRLGVVRVAGVDLLWWYAGLVAPVAAAVTALLAMRPDTAPDSVEERASRRIHADPPIARDSPARSTMVTHPHRRAVPTSRSGIHGDRRARRTGRAGRARR